MKDTIPIKYSIYSLPTDIEAIYGTKVDLTKLKDNQGVCSGDGKSYHFLLTKKN